MTKSFLISRAVAAVVKRRAPDVITVFGGAHPSCAPEIVRSSAIDVVVVGEGERTLLDIVRAVEQGEGWQGTEGIAYWDAGLRETSPRSRIQKLDELPWPLRRAEWLQKSQVAAPIYPLQRNQTAVAQIHYSRGCHFGCAFCCSPRLWRHRVCWRSPASVAREMKYLHKQFDVNLFFFTDLTFNYTQDKAEKLCDEFQRERLDVNWTVDDGFLRETSPDLFKKMARAGCTRIAWGLESIEDVTLSKVAKPRSLELVRTLLGASDAAGIINRCFLMIGFPWESKEMILGGLKTLKTLPIDSIRISFPTPFPGTPLWQRMGGQRTVGSTDRLTTDEPVLPVGGMSRQDLVALRQRVFREFYRSPEYEARRRRKVKRFPHLKKSFEEYMELLHQARVLSSHD